MGGRKQIHVGASKDLLEGATRSRDADVHTAGRIFIHLGKEHVRLVHPRRWKERHAIATEERSNLLSRPAYRRCRCYNLRLHWRAAILRMPRAQGLDRSLVEAHHRPEGPRDQ